MAEPVSGPVSNHDDDLVHLAVMVEAALRFGDPSRACSLGERLLELLSRHYRAMRPLRLRCEPRVGAALADEAFTLIDDLEQVVSGGGYSSLAGLRERVERLMEHEAAVVMTLGSPGTAG
jgi:hypothetical protein